MGDEYIKVCEKLKESLLDNAHVVGDGNTFYIAGLVDAKALCYAINNYVGGNAKAFFDNFDGEDAPYLLTISCDRYAMDQNGFHVGYETFKITVPVHRKADFGIFGIPHALSDGVILLANFLHADIDIEAPDPEYSYDSYNDEDEIPEVLYYPPDEEFAWTEIRHVISEALRKLPVADFNPNTRTWELGDEKYVIGS